MFSKNEVTLRSRSEVGTRDNVKFIEPNYRTLGWRSALFKNSIMAFRLVIFLVFLGLLARILFMEGGYLDLVSKKTNYSELTTKYESILENNLEMKKEIKKIKDSSSYQRKLARDYLGVIAEDELLILFRPKPKA